MRDAILHQNSTQAAGNSGETQTSQKYDNSAFDQEVTTLDHTLASAQIINKNINPMTHAMQLTVPRPARNKNLKLLLHAIISRQEPQTNTSKRTKG